MTTRRDNWV